MKIFHVAPWMQTTDPRVLRARDTWKVLYDDYGWVMTKPDYGLLSSIEIGDERRLFLMRDLLDVAFLYSHDESDVLVMTCDDVILHPCLDAQVRQLSQRCGLFTGHRIDCDKYEERLSSSDLVIENIGRVLIGCRAEWWQYHGTLLPDCYCGTSRSDLCIAALARKLAGSTWTKETSGVHDPSCELLPGCIYHERHKRTWDETMPADKHDAEIVLEWFERNMPEATPQYMKE